jgi:hypothetical protein
MKFAGLSIYKVEKAAMELCQNNMTLLPNCPNQNVSSFFGILNFKFSHLEPLIEDEENEEQSNKFEFVFAVEAEVSSALEGFSRDSFVDAFPEGNFTYSPSKIERIVVKFPKKAAPDIMLMTAPELGKYLGTEDFQTYLPNAFCFVEVLLKPFEIKEGPAGVSLELRSMVILGYASTHQIPSPTKRALMDLVESIRNKKSKQ